MGWLKKLLGGEDRPEHRRDGDTAQPTEHAVLLHIRLSNDTMGTGAEVQSIHALSDELGAAIARSHAGELDGDEFGGGYCVLYMYGPSADELWDAIAPVLEKQPFRRGSRAVKRYGAPGESREETIDLHWDG